MEEQVILQILSVPLAGGSLYFMYKIVSNHINHSTESTDRLTAAIQELTESTQEFQSWFRGWVSRDRKDY